MQEILIANKKFFSAACQQPPANSQDDNGYTAARTDAIIALTNLSDNFQQMLAEPGQGKVSSHVHQFVIASHTLTSRISALSPKDLKNIPPDILTAGQKNITQMLTASVENLNASENNSWTEGDIATPFHSINPISIIYSLARELRNISLKIGSSKE